MIWKMESPVVLIIIVHIMMHFLVGICRRLWISRKRRSRSIGFVNVFKNFSIRSQNLLTVLSVDAMASDWASSRIHRIYKLFILKIMKQENPRRLGHHYPQQKCFTASMISLCVIIFFFSKFNCNLWDVKNV